MHPTHISHSRPYSTAPGWQTFKYGKLGEVTENIRTFALPFENQTYTFKMQYEYDPFNRIQSILYPDSELVEYSYNLGGMLSKVTGSVTRKVTDLVGPMQMHGGSLLPGGDELMGGGAVSGDISGNDPFFIPTETIRYSYIDSIVYNEFELKDSVVYGNGTRVRYAYDSLYRLVRLRSYTAEDELMQDIAYHYDSVGNILDIENMAATLSNGLGGAYRQEYTYDNLYRLDNATGWWEYRPLHLTLHDTVNMRYSKNGRIIRKQEYAETFKNSLLNLVRYDRQYQYSSPYSNKLGSVTDAMSGASQQFGWDGCGNMVRHGNPEQGCDRRLSWTEDNRLQFVKDNGSTGAYYQYDAGGDRTYKLLYHKTTGSLNGVQTDYYTLDGATLYVSPYLVVTPQGYTKHYYAESERITTQLGKYRFAVVDSCVAGDSLAHIKLQNAAQAFPTDSFPTPMPMLGYLHSLTNHPNTVSTLYFYHPDHLGSASWITNIYGRTIQHLYYLPWGEDFVNQRTGSFSSMYTFSAKEKDTETGYSYFGARYYSSDLSEWLSVDPMASKYPSLSSYVYCADNPVKLVDPNGNFPIIPFLIKAGINAMADCLMQAAMNYYFNPQTAGDLRASFLNINGWITLKSGAEGAIPWKIPGGKAGRAAVTAAGDVLAYFCASPKQYTTKQALEDFTVGFIGELAGGGLSDLIAKYGAPAVAKGLCRIPGFSVNKIRDLTGYNLVSDYAQNLTKRLKGSTCKEAKGDGFIINYQDYVIRIMNSGGERAEPYFRISNKKGSIDINGRYSSDRGKTHCSFNDDPTEKIIEIIKTNKNL